jgi:hypothetical protein
MLRLTLALRPIADTFNEVIADFFKEPVKKPRRLNYEDHDMNTQGHSLTLPIPRRQVVLLKNQHTKTLRESQLYQQFNRLTQVGKYSGGTDASNVFVAAALASAPSIPYSTLAKMMPLLFMGLFMIDSGITSQNKFDLEKYIKSYPCDTFLLYLMYKVAATCSSAVH